MRRNSHSDGFTLIELLVVIVLLGILSGIAVFAVGNARDDAVVQACRSQQAQLLKGVDLNYIAKNGVWPGIGTSTSDPLKTKLETPRADTFDVTTVVPGTSTLAYYEYTYAQLNAALVPEQLKQLPPYLLDGVSNAAFRLGVILRPKNGTKSAWAQVIVREWGGKSMTQAEGLAFTDCPPMPRG